MIKIENEDITHTPEMSTIISKTPVIVIRYSIFSILFALFMIYLFAFKLTINKTLNIKYNSIMQNGSILYTFDVDSNEYFLIKKFNKVKMPLLGTNETKEVLFSIWSCERKYKINNRVYNNLLDISKRDNFKINKIDVIYHLKVNIGNNNSSRILRKGEATIEYNKSSIFNKFLNSKKTKGGNRSSSIKRNYN